MCLFFTGSRLPSRFCLNAAFKLNKKRILISHYADPSPDCRVAFLAVFLATGVTALISTAVQSTCWKQSSSKQHCTDLEGHWNEWDWFFWGRFSHYIRQHWHPAETFYAQICITMINILFSLPVWLITTPLFMLLLFLYLGSPFGGGKDRGCSPSKLLGAEGGVSKALWWEEVSRSGSTVWHAWSFKWKRWPQYRILWDTVRTLEKPERSANVTAHCS